MLFLVRERVLQVIPEMEVCQRVKIELEIFKSGLDGSDLGEKVALAPKIELVDDV